MKNRFQSEIDARLANLTFTGQAQVLERVRARRSPHALPKRAVVLVLVLMLAICGTAVALTLRYSARFDLERHARGVLSSKYGLTSDMLDLFTSYVEQREDGWTVRFAPIAWKDLMGEYTVTDGADEITVATWSHDGAEPSRSVWGPEELQMFMDARKAQHAAEALTLDASSLTLEERAAIDAPVLALDGINWRVNIVPGTDDLQPEDAERLARQVVMDSYGVSEDALRGYKTDTYFYMYTGEGRRQYRIDFHGDAGVFFVNISSPEGEILSRNWWVAKDIASLPEGDLSRYPEAAEQFVEEGVFEALSPVEKAEVYRRYEEAGLSDLLPEGEFVSPAPADLNEQEAIAVAREAVMARYSFPEAGFALFGTRTALLRREDGREWQVRFIGQLHPRYLWLKEASLGSYTVRMTSDGAVMGCEWSLDAMFEGAHTEDTFGQAQVFTGDDLGYVLILIDKLDAIYAKYPQDPDYAFNSDDLSIEDHAAFDGLMRQAGFNPRTYPSLLPRESDLTEQEALELARQVLRDEYGVTDETLNQSNLEVSFQMRYNLHEEPVRVWDFVFKGREVYWVCINAEEGVIEEIEHDDLSFTNG